MSAPDRRAVLRASLAALLPGASAAAAAPHPDAELIRRCQAYVAAVDAFWANGPDAPDFDEVIAAHDAAAEFEPETLDGVRAMALVAKREALQADGSEDWSDSYTGKWPQWIAEAVLNLVPDIAA